ncbi:MAG TPA: glycoside hydrolase family 43 protein [Balneolaceae bacterium]|nr:glycoside hydrolase family 43 protein [Balneolaceae bacterium]
MRKFLMTLILALAAVQCTSQASSEGAGTPCVFSNPIAPGADPWVLEKDGLYYFSESHGGAVHISVSESMTDIKSGSQKVWEQPRSGWNSAHLWAPELHYVRGNWYIYYTAGESGPPFIHQRSGVLRAVTDDPLGEYEDLGMLYTGDDIATKKDAKWAIDLTVLEMNQQLYAIWSGWEENAETDRTPQHLYIAQMENPWTVSSNRVKISSPEEPWEAGTELAINEGPQVLKNGSDVFIVYSASESWLPTYNLGLLKLRSPDADLLDPQSWVKEGSVFQGEGNIFGVGHASFTTSPDGSENWIYYHTKSSPDPGWNRAIHLQPFNWRENGRPDFGRPIQPGVAIEKPSGSCW